MDFPRNWRRRRSPGRLHAPASALLVALVCLGAVTAGIWLGRYVYDSLITAGSGGEIGGRPPVKETWSVLPPGTELWWVQVGAFQDAARAGAERDRLEAKGYPVYTSSRGPSPVLHKVRVGVFAKKGAAAALEKELKAAGFAVYLSALPLNTHPVTIAAAQRAYLEEVAAGLEVLGGFLADQAGWWGARGGWGLDRTVLAPAIAVHAPLIRQFQVWLAAAAVPADEAELHRKVTALADLAAGSLGELERFAAKGERPHMTAAMVAFMRLVDAYDAFWASE